MSGNGKGEDIKWPAGRSATGDDWWQSCQRFRALAQQPRGGRIPSKPREPVYGLPRDLQRIARLCARMAARPMGERDLEGGSFW